MKFKIGDKVIIKGDKLLPKNIKEIIKVDTQSKSYNLKYPNGIIGISSWYDKELDLVESEILKEVSKEQSKTEVSITIKTENNYLKLSREEAKEVAEVLKSLGF